MSRERLEHQVNTLTEVIAAYSEAATAYSGLLAAIAHKAATELGDLCFVLMLSDDEQTLEIVGSHATDASVLALATEMFTGKQLAVVPIQRQAMRTASIFVAPEVTPERAGQVTTPDRAEFIKRIGMHSVVAIGLRARAEPVGILNLVRHRPTTGPFGEPDRDRLQKLATPCALAVGNARLLKHLLAALRLAHEVALAALFRAVTPMGNATLDDKVSELLLHAGGESLLRLQVDAADLRYALDNMR